VPGATVLSFEIDIPAQLASDRPFKHHLFETLGIVTGRGSVGGAVIAMPKGMGLQVDVPVHLLQFEGSIVHLKRS
jgi:hypothetical protein